MLKPILIVSLMLFSMQAFSQTSQESAPASTSTPASTPTPVSAPASLSPSHALTFQIIQDQFVLDNTTVKNARIIESENGSFQGLNVELKPEAAKILTDMTQAGQGRQMNIVFNKVVVSSAAIQGPLGGNFLISGISKQDAQSFLNVLIANKPKSEEEPAQN